MHNVNKALGGTARRGVTQAAAPGASGPAGASGGPAGVGAAQVRRQGRPPEGARGPQASTFRRTTGRGAERPDLGRVSRGRRSRPTWRTRSCFPSELPAAPRGCGPARPGPSSSSAAGPAAGSAPCAGAAGGACGGGCSKPRRPARTGGRAAARCRARRPGGPRPRPAARPRPRRRRPLARLAPRPSPSRRCGRLARAARCCCCRWTRWVAPGEGEAGGPGRGGGAAARTRGLGGERAASAGSRAPARERSSRRRC